jgi:uncharacterized membrane protein YedE/YeeE
MKINFQMYYFNWPCSWTFGLYFFTKKDVVFNMTSSLPLIIIGGLFVGIGTEIARGCTSGHGICGISRFSSRSIVATIIFMSCAIITVFLLQFQDHHNKCIIIYFFN